MAENPLNEKRVKYDKWVARMIADEDGRKAIGDALGLNLVKHEELKNEPIVAVLVPSYNGLDPKMMDSCSAMIKYTQKFCTVFSEPVMGSSLIPWTRNDMTACLHGKKWTHALMIDDDMVVEKDALVRLIRHDVDVVGTAYVHRTDPPVPNIHYINIETGEAHRVLHWNTEGLLKSPDPQHTLSVGTGMMLAKREVYERVAKFYLDCEYEKKYWKLTDEQIAPIKAKRQEGFAQTHNGWWFELLPRMIGFAQNGEDTSFCIKAAMCGFTVWADTSIQPGHVGQYTYSMQDYLAFKEGEITKAKAKNSYCEL